MKKIYFTTTILLLSHFMVYGQLSTNEKPVSFRKNIPALVSNEKTEKSFPALDMKKIEQEDNEDELSGFPPRFGYRHKVNYTLENSGEWTILENGDKIWRLSISCQNALSINLLYDKFWLPEGAKLFIYSNDRKHSIGAFTSENNTGDRNDVQGFATGLVFGDQITLEYWLPKEIKDSGVISIAYVVHGYRYILIPEDYEETHRGYGQSLPCHINVICSTSWSTEKNAIAMILINGGWWCTGSLINTTANDYSLYLLTADHCLMGYDAVNDNSPNLPYWTFYWHYESPTCLNAFPSTINTTNGARLIANLNYSY